MRTTGGDGRGRQRGTVIVGCGLLALAMVGCSQPEPDVQQVARAVGALPGVTAVDASFTGTSLGGSGDQELEVEVTNPPDAQQVEGLIARLPKVLQDIENGDGYDEFVIATQTPAEAPGARPDVSSISFGPELTPTGLATRWAKAVVMSPPGELLVRVPPSPRHVTASMSSHEPVSATLAWALGSGLTDLHWSVVDYQTSESPYARFSIERPVDVAMVQQWKAIEAAYAGDDGTASIARAVVVEDVKGVRKAKVSVSYPDVSGPLPAAEYGPQVWPIVDAINASLPMGHRLDLELARTEKGEQGGAGDGELVDGGIGSADWEAAYRQRFPDAVPVSAPPT